MYYVDNGQYPPIGYAETSYDGSGGLVDYLSPDYLLHVPNDPLAPSSHLYFYYILNGVSESFIFDRGWLGLDPATCSGKYLLVARLFETDFQPRQDCGVLWGNIAVIVLE